MAEEKINLTKIESYILIEKYVSTMTAIVDQMMFVVNQTLAMVQLAIAIKEKQQNRIDIV
jgi:hypothetical protein